MVYRIVATCCLVLLLPALALAQNATAPPKAKTLEELTKDVQDLQRQLATTNANLTTLTEQVATNVEATTKNTQSIDRITNVIQDDLAKQQDAQQRILDNINYLLAEQKGKLDDVKAILDAITYKDSKGNDVLRLSAKMAQSEEFRDDVRSAVHQSLETHGDFSIHNRMGTYQRVVVNQREYGLNPDEILTLKVPVGTVTARLPGQSLTTWTVGAPNYSQRIEIVPDGNPVTVYRPISGEVAVPSYPLSPPVWDPFYLTPLPPPPPPIYVGPVRHYLLPF
jgi:hypothetical protein